MSAWRLPTAIQVSGREYAIRSDYRCALDACAALQDAELTDQDKALAVLQIMLPDWRSLPDAGAALAECMTFLNCGDPVQPDQPPRPQLVDWDRDANLIAAAVDAVLGYSCRRAEYLHWWEFIGAYQCIGDGLFSQVVGIRYKRAHGKPLDKHEREFAREHPELVELYKTLTSAEEDFFKALGV